MTPRPNWHFTLDRLGKVTVRTQPRITHGSAEADHLQRRLFYAVGEFNMGVIWSYQTDLRDVHVFVRETERLLLDVARTFWAKMETLERLDRGHVPQVFAAVVILTTGRYTASGYEASDAILTTARGVLADHDWPGETP